MRRVYCAIFYIQCIFLNTCLGELSVEKKQEFLNGFIESLNSLPDQPYTYEEGVLVDAQKTDEDNNYKITVRLKVSDIHDIDVVKILKCTGSVLDGNNGVTVRSDHQCEEDPESAVSDAQDSADNGSSTELPAEGITGPVQLDNEVQSDAEVTSGEQFVAIPRPSVPCIGCASHVDPSAAGVPEMAHLGIRHLDLHDPSAKHALKTVVEVERQVQVVNGVRYILTLLVDFNNCTAPEAEPCPVSTPCKISILEKPWKKLPNGSKYRAIIANNCTTEWLFGDEGEVLPNERNNENNELYPNSSSSFDDDLKVVHNFDTQAQPNQEKPLTDEMIKNVEEQIIPLSEFTTPETLRTVPAAENSAPALENTEHVQEDETVKHYNENSASAQQSQINQPSSLNEDQKRAIDDMMNFFNFAGFHKPETSVEHQRSKRSYDYDLKVLALAKKFQNVKRSIDNANYVQKLAQTMVEYLNEHDMVVKDRVLKDVLAADQEIENDQHFVYLQALITIPCDKVQCKAKDDKYKICNGVIDGSNMKFPQILNTFCYDEEKKRVSNKVETVPFDDPVLVKLAKRALMKIESESTKDNAMKILKILDATTQKASGRLTTISMLLSYTNCKKSLEFYQRLNCSAVQNMGSQICDVTIHEKKDVKITYICNERGIHESFVDTEHFSEKKKIITDPEIHNMVHEALQYLEKQSNRNSKQKVVAIKSVSTKVVAGLLTDVAFTVGYTDCQNDKDVDINTCQLLLNEAIRECKAQVWDRPWLENGRQVSVKCNSKPSNTEDNNFSKFKKKSHVIHKRHGRLGGKIEKNSNDPKYKQLAEESLQKHLESTGTSLSQKVVQVSKVTTQVVSGLITEIDFDVYPTNSDTFDCHSKIWEQPWLQKKEITVNCNMNDQQSRVKRGIPGGLTEQDPSEPQYSALAEESLQKYIQSTGSKLNDKVIKITKVTTQVVSGFMTTIFFNVLSSNSGSLTCKSAVWEQPWLKKKEITVDCNINNKVTRIKRQIVGGYQEQNANDPKYKTLAEESLEKYLKSITGGPLQIKQLVVSKVTTQVVAGIKTRIDFDVYPANGDSIKCQSEVWEQAWLKKKEITVNCGLSDQQTRKKREMVAGGLQDQNQSDPKYSVLAEESLQKYLQTSGGTLNERKIEVTKVTTQVVAGSLTRIDFNVRPTNGDLFTCHSEVLEQAWLNKKEITVNCNMNDNRVKVKRQIAGGQNDADPNDPKYTVLAEESLQKYLQTSGGTLNERKIEVTKVTTQVVAGSLTRIDFNVRPKNGDLFTCHSEVFEQPWLNKKEVTVNCNMNDKLARVKRQIAGGENDADPNDPKYSVLAEESLEKYLQTSGGTLNERKIEVTKVTTQVVAGSLTRIDFNVRPKNGDLFTCHSEVLEQPWLNKKEVTVNCNMNDQQKRKKRGFSGSERKRGSPQEENSTKPEYKLLAEQSLQKYMKLQDSHTRHDVLEVKRVTSQVVAGKLYEIDFTAVPTTCSVTEINISKCRAKNNTLLFCHSKIWSRVWLNSNKIDVICNSDTDESQTDDMNEEDEKKRSTTGDAQEKIKTNSINIKNDEVIIRKPVGANEHKLKNDEYINLAKEAVLKFERLSNSKYLHRILKIHHVSEQVNEGILTSIEFSMSPTKCLIGDGLNVDECKFKQPKVEFLCLSTIWERSWIYLKDIKVTCKNMKAKHVTPVEWDAEIPGARQIEREKRQLRGEDDDYIDDDLTFYYADRAVKEINEKSQSHNLQKLITVHAIDDSVQMGARMIRMYIETAVTFCLRPQAGVELSECEEINGLNRKLCHVRLWPDPDDDLIVKNVAVVCDDDSDFSSVTGLSIPALITASIKEIEKSQNIKFKLVHQGEPNIVPTLSSKHPIKMSFVVASTNCSKDIDVYKHRDICFVDTATPSSACESLTWFVPNSMEVKDVNVKCNGKTLDRKKRSVNISTNKTSVDITIAQLVDESLEKLESSSTHRYKQRVLQINSYSTKIRKGRVTTIDFDVGFTSCLKYEYIENISTCEFIEHLPRRHCVSHVFERLWVDNGRNIEVICEDDETPLEPHVGLESSEMAMQLADEALKHIEAKYPHPRRLKVVRIFSLEKQALAGIHYRMKLEVGVTDCMALSVKSDCKLKQDTNLNKFCRVNVWIRPWTEHAPNFRVWCDYHESLTTEHHHLLQAEQLFYDFLTTNNPDYVDDYTEMAKRFAIFRANVRKVHELNIHEKGTARYAMTQFSDLTYEEFNSKYLGLKPGLKNANEIPMVKADIPDVTLPDMFDWRDRGAVTEVKNQGSCGSCWAFSVTGNIEGQWKLQTGKLVSLSEQELVDCDKLDQGCNGGLPDNAYRAIEELGGLELETDYPYEGEDDKCVFNKTLSKVQISGAVNISSNETEMAKWLVENGPISIGINANAMQFYVGGISHPWKVLCSPSNLDHGVLIVGFGAKDYPLFHKHLPYWIVKNSWGKQWGEQGYYRVYRGDGTCGVNQMASSAVV